MHPSHERLTILVVDDEPENVRILGEALKDEYNVSVATNGKDALIAAMSEPHPDLILLDIVMPQMHGYAVCEHLKGNPGTAEIPIIFVTSLEDDEDEAKGLALGAADYVTKPLSISILKARVGIHLQLKQHQQFVESLLSGSDRGVEETKSEARALLKQLGNE